MLIYNTTFHVEDEVQEQFVDFIRNVYIKEAMRTDMLSDPRFTKIHPQHEQNGNSFSLQFKVEDQEVLNLWQSVLGNKLHKIIISEFGGRVMGFVTLMDEIEL
ncbi:MAG: DUF4286 family protein [Dysgonomonas sp.]